MLSSVDSGKYFSQPLRFAVDLLLVCVFIGIGLTSHHENLSKLPVTATPFLLAAVAAHLGIWAVNSRRQLPLLLEGLMVWVTTLVLGVGLRVSFGNTAATAFIVVSALTLLIFFIGWRCVLLLARRNK